METMDKKDVIDLLSFCFYNDCTDFCQLYVKAMQELGMNTDTDAKPQWTSNDVIDCAMKAIRKNDRKLITL